MFDFVFVLQSCMYDIPMYNFHLNINELAELLSDRLNR